MGVIVCQSSCKKITSCCFNFQVGLSKPVPIIFTYSESSINSTEYNIDKIAIFFIYDQIIYFRCIDIKLDVVRSKGFDDVLENGMHRFLLRNPHNRQASMQQATYRKSFTQIIVREKQSKFKSVSSRLASLCNRQTVRHSGMPTCGLQLEKWHIYCSLLQSEKGKTTYCELYRKLMIGHKH